MIERHRYWPSYMHMGDCTVCGNLQDDPVHDMTAPVPSDIDGPAGETNLIERLQYAAVASNMEAPEKTVEWEAASALAAYQARLNTSEISRSAWEDSARINKGRADAAEAKVDALTAKIAKLEKRIIDANWFAYHKNLAEIGIHDPLDRTWNCIGTDTRKFEVAKALKRLDVIEMENNPNGPVVRFNLEQNL